MSFQDCWPAACWLHTNAHAVFWKRLVAGHTVSKNWCNVCYCLEYFFNGTNNASVTVLPLSSSRAVAGASWNNTTRELVVTILSDIGSDSDVEMLISNVVAPSYVRPSASATLVSKTAQGLIVDGPSNIDIDAIKPSMLRGDLTLRFEHAQPPGVPQLTNLSFRALSPVPIGGQIVLKMPDDKWNIATFPSILFESPAGMSGGALVKQYKNFGGYN